MKYLGFMIVIATVMLPCITGYMAVVGEFKNQWSGFVESPAERFEDYACPIPVCAGCQNLIFYPITFGPLFLLYINKIRRFILPVIAIYLIVFVSKCVYETATNHLQYTCSELTSSSLALLILTAVCLIDGKAIMQKQ